MENKIVYHSNTGNSKAVALYLRDRLGMEAADIETESSRCFGALILVFPVHCQNIPQKVKDFLKDVRAERAIVLATYGKMWHGNVLQEIQKKYPLRIVGGGYIPTKHSYSEGDTPFTAYEELRFVEECLERDREIVIPRSFKNPLADLFPVARSQWGVKLVKNENCNGCDACQCKEKKCIRCLKCVEKCPRRAIEVKLRLPLRLYLKKKKADKLVIYQ